MDQIPGSSQIRYTRVQCYEEVHRHEEVGSPGAKRSCLAEAPGHTLQYLEGEWAATRFPSNSAR